MTVSSLDASTIRRQRMLSPQRAEASRQSLSWFEFGLGLFALSVPVGLLIVWMGPVDFIKVMGLIIVGTGLIGVWVSAAGLKLEHPARWRSLVASFTQRESSRGARLHQAGRYSS